MIPLLALLVLLAAFAAVWVVAYRRLASLFQRANTAFAVMGEHFERREEIAPALVDSVQGFLEPENDVLIDVIVSRAAAVQARDEVAGSPMDLDAVHSLSNAQGAFGVAVRNLIEATERYPEIESDDATVQLIEDLRSVGNRVSFARQAYNDVTKVYEAYRRAYPYAIVAAVTGFEPLAGVEEAPTEARRAQRV